MTLPFAFDQFLSVFVAYNTTIWPAQVFLNIAAIIAIARCFRKPVASKVISAILAGLWLWTGIVYHWIFFASINPAAHGFGVIFVGQAILFLVYGTVRCSMTFQFDYSLSAFVGAVFILYALLVYPVIGCFLGHAFPASPTFGAPCPTTIFTFGLLLWTTNHVRWYVYVLPLVWALIGSSAAFKLGMVEDIGLLISAIVGTILLYSRPTMSKTSAAL
jgi:hypothetical protein